MIVTRVAEAPLPDAGGVATNATCLPGERLLSGGARVVGSTSDDVQLTSSRPQTAAGTDPLEGEAPTQWRAAAFNPTGGAPATTLKVFAICIQ